MSIEIIAVKLWIVIGLIQVSPAPFEELIQSLDGRERIWVEEAQVIQ